MCYTTCSVVYAFLLLSTLYYQLHVNANTVFLVTGEVVASWLRETTDAEARDGEEAGK